MAALSCHGNCMELRQPLWQGKQPSTVPVGSWRSQNVLVDAVQGELMWASFPSRWQQLANAALLALGAC